MRTFFRKIAVRFRCRRLGLEFPLFCKVHGVKAPDFQGALAQSRAGDGLQLVHVPLETRPENVYVYSIELNRILGRLESGLSEKLVRRSERVSAWTGASKTSRAARPLGNISAATSASSTR